VLEVQFEDLDVPWAVIGLDWIGYHRLVHSEKRMERNAWPGSVVVQDDKRTSKDVGAEHSMTTGMDVDQDACGPLDSNDCVLSGDEACLKTLLCGERHECVFTLSGHYLNEALEFHGLAWWADFDVVHMELLVHLCLGRCFMGQTNNGCVHKRTLFSNSSNVRNKSISFFLQCGPTLLPLPCLLMSCQIFGFDAEKNRRYMQRQLEKWLRSVDIDEPS
jgi:hypothetical protein